MASRITHIAIKSPRFYFLKIKCTFFLVVETKRQQEKILNSPSNPSTKQQNTAINIRATDLLCGAWKCHVTINIRELTAQI